MSKVLVAFFSRAHENYYEHGIRDVEVGNTKLLAQALAQRIEKSGNHEVTVFEVETDYEYSHNYHECTQEAKALAARNYRPKLQSDIKVQDFDAVLLGFPIWWGTMPLDIKAFVEQHRADFTGKMILPFCTHEGSHFDRSLVELRAMLPEATIGEGLALYGHLTQDSARLTKALEAKAPSFLGQLH